MAAPQVIDWQSLESHYFLNPRLPTTDRERLENARHELPNLPGHIWVLTSGTTGASGFKWVALSKKAFLVSAAAVNSHLQVNQKDVWMLALPQFHVGGLAILARAHLSNCQVPEFLDPWNAVKFHDRLVQTKTTLCSLVPTQLHDLVTAGLHCPDSVRVIVIGGAALHGHLFERALELGYPLSLSYGMTETCSQVAASTVGESELLPLSHAQIETDVEGRIRIKSEALLTGLAVITDEGVAFTDPKNNGWFQTEDLGFLEKQILHVEGRASDQIKISGELVLLPRLQSLLASYVPEAIVIAVPDDRLGHRLAAVLPVSKLGPAGVDSVAAFNAQVAPFERVTSVYFVPRIPRNELGKVGRSHLFETLKL
jgi:o-succinylbenzoate---CoA ligase